MLLSRFMDEMTHVPEHAESDESKVPTEPLPPIESRFLFVDVAALRAKQLRRGAHQRLGEETQLPHKAERVAMEEVKRGLVYYDVTHPKLPQGDGAEG